MCKIKLCALLIFFVWGAQAQIEANYEWAEMTEIGTLTNPDYTEYITDIDSEGNVYLTGYKENGIIYGIHILGDIFLRKYDSEGQLLFTKNFLGDAQVFNMKADFSGNVYLLAGFFEELTVGTTVFENSGITIRYVLLKLDSNGDLLWSYSPSVIEDWFLQDCYAITVAPNNDVYVGYGTYSDTFITKLDSNGTEINTITQTGVKLITSIDLDTDGNLYVAGSCAEPTANYNGVLSPTTFQYSVYLAKYSSDAVFQWVKYKEDITCPFPQVAANSPDEVYLSSQLWDNLPFEGISLEGPIAGGEDFFIAKFNTLGTIQWIKELQGAGEVVQGSQNFLEADSQGNVSFVGKFRGNINWGAQVTASTGTSYDAIFLKYNTAGELLFVKTVHSQYGERFDNVVTDTDGSSYVSGLGFNQIQMGELLFGSGNDAYFPFLTKISTQNLSTDQPEFQSIRIYPNPCENYFMIDGIEESTEVTLYNTFGQRVKKVIITPSQPVNTTDLPTGIYLLKTEKSLMKIVKR
ncbi:MAG: T9SS type A sorting domain-containing protein [Flavobacteriaceae bacterium]